MVTINKFIKHFKRFTLNMLCWFEALKESIGMVIPVDSGAKSMCDKWPRDNMSHSKNNTFFLQFTQRG